MTPKKRCSIRNAAFQVRKNNDSERKYWLQRSH
jgi:hypothetical protein